MNRFIYFIFYIYLSFIINIKLLQNIKFCQCNIFLVPLVCYLIPVIFFVYANVFFYLTNGIPYEIAYIGSPAKYFFSIAISYFRDFTRGLDCENRRFVRFFRLGDYKMRHKYRGHSETGFRAYASIQGVPILQWNKNNTNLKIKIITYNVKLIIHYF